MCVTFLPCFDDHYVATLLLDPQARQEALVTICTSCDTMGHTPAICCVHLSSVPTPCCVDLL